MENQFRLVTLKCYETIFEINFHHENKNYTKE